jgi:hypothetical protein
MASMVHSTNDHRKIVLETPLYDVLYAWCQHEVAPVMSSTS